MSDKALRIITLGFSVIAIILLIIQQRIWIQ